MKKGYICFMVFITILLSFNSTAIAKGEPVGQSVVQDHMLFINGNSIPAAQLPNQFVYLKVDDLEYYGFDVDLAIQESKKIYTITRNVEKGIRPVETPSADEPVAVYTTDAQVYIDSDIPANVFELEDGTVLVQSDELAKYGTYAWNTETHRISINFKKEQALPPYQTFHNAIGLDDRTEIKHGAIVNSTEKRCADIDDEDLSAWLAVYWDFTYDRVIAPLAAYDLSGNYIKLWNEDKSKSYTVYPNGGIIVGKYGGPYETHGEIKQNYIWYLPVVGNSRNALNTANGTLERIYFYKDYQGYKDREREFTPADEADIPSHDVLVTGNASEWARPEIEKAAACNLMVYDLSDHYTQPITRYEFCQLAYRLIATEFAPYTDSRTGISFAIQDILTEKGITGAYDNKFTDCYHTEVEVLASMGIIEGMGDGTFAPDESITREQAATILYRMAEFLGNKTIPYIPQSQYYFDLDAISPWALNPARSMYLMNIMHGDTDGLFHPQNPYTVEQAIATMLRLYECS